MEYLLGIDNGGTMTKAALFDLNGNEISVSSHKTEMICPKPGFTEKSTDDLWNANINAISEVIKKSGVDSEKIKAVAVTGFGNGMFLIGHDGKPVYNGIVSTDSRAKEIVKKWYSDGTFEEVHKLTNQSIWAAQPVSLIAWFQDNMIDILDKSKWVLMCKDFIRYCLTGEVFAEISDYSGTSSINLNTQNYDEVLFSKFGISKYARLFPPLKKSSDICGYITKDVALKTGLKEGTPVAGGLFDIDACCLATGVIDEDKLSLVGGTWSINQVLSSKPIVPNDLFMTSLFCINQYYLILEASPTSASNLEWFITEFLNNQKIESDKKGESIYEYCTKLVEKVPPEESDVIFLPYLYGSNSRSDIKSGFYGMSSWNKMEHIVRAIYEGIVFSSKQHVDKLFEYTKKPPMARIAGGASKSKTWVQIFADVLQMPIEITEGSELGALGAAICAGVACGIFRSYENAVNSMVKVSSVCYPDKDKIGIYTEKYKKYKKLVNLLEQM